MDLFVGLIIVGGASALEWLTTRPLARRLRWQETGRCMDAARAIVAGESPQMG